MPIQRPRIQSRLDAAVGKRGGIAAVPALCAALYHRKEEIRQAAAWSLGDIGHDAAVPDLLAALGDEDWLVRRNAIDALGKIGHAGAAPRLLALLDDPDPRVRGEAAEVLGKFAYEQAVEPLINRLQDDAECRLEKFKGLLVRDVAAQALRKIGTPAALTAVQDMLSDRAQDAAPPAAHS